MGALRQPKLDQRTSSTRKSADRAEFADTYGRDPKLPCEKLRARSRAWKTKGTGYAPLPAAIMADLPRLSSGHLEDMLVFTIIMESWGRPRDTKEGMPEWTNPLEVRELAQRCSGATGEKDMDAAVRSVQRLLVDMAPPTDENPRGRGMVEVRREDRGKVSLKLRWEEWPKLPDYREWLELNRPKAVDESDESDAPGEGETAPVVKGAVFLSKKPQTIRPGQSKTLKVECGVTSFEFRNPFAIDLRIHPVVQGGRLLFAPELVDDDPQKSVSGSNGINKLLSTKRHACRLDEKAAPANGGNDEREEMLCRVFDPRLQKSGAPLLSFDRKALAKSCEAAGEIPEAALLAFLAKRYSKTISRPLSVPAICNEARQNWEKVERDFQSVDQPKQRTICFDNTCPGCGHQVSFAFLPDAEESECPDCGEVVTLEGLVRGL
jgi:hypothetical protein